MKLIMGHSMPPKYLFSNSPTARRDYTENFFYNYSSRVLSAQLACPFFTDVGPLRILKQAGCSQIRLLIRLCDATTASALEEARSLDGVQIRFFTARSFHAKFYILENVALIGSANLTGAGLRSNRELSVLVTADQDWFDELPAQFDELWEAASVLTDDAQHRFSTWERSIQRTVLPDGIPGIDDVSPPTVNVQTRKRTRERTYLETFRRYYYEILIPYYKNVEHQFVMMDRRHPSFETLSLKYEVDRFLSWAKLTFTSDETLPTFPLREGADLEANIKSHIEKWMTSKVDIDPIVRLGKISRLHEIFRTRNSLSTSATPSTRSTRRPRDCNHR